MKGPAEMAITLKTDEAVAALLAIREIAGKDSRPESGIRLATVYRMADAALEKCKMSPGAEPVLPEGSRKVYSVGSTSSHGFQATPEAVAKMEADMAAAKESINHILRDADA